jgi:hypothetical protein
VKENKTFKNDIDRAERALLAYSWLGVFSAFLVIGYCIRSLM